MCHINSNNASSQDASNSSESHRSDSPSTEKKTNKYTSSISITDRKWYYLGKRKTLLDFPREAVSSYTEGSLEMWQKRSNFYTLSFVGTSNKPFCIWNKDVWDTKLASSHVWKFKVHASFNNKLIKYKSSKHTCTICVYIYLNRKWAMDYAKENRRDVQKKGKKNYNNIHPCMYLLLMITIS